jgi:WD40 repeat protein
MAAKKQSAADPAAPTPGLWPVSVFTHTIAFIPGARRMLTGHALSNEILEWDLDTGAVVTTRRKGRKTKDGINQIAIRADGKQFIAVDQSGMAGSTSFVRVWSLAPGAKAAKDPEIELLGHKGPVTSCAYLPDGKALTGGMDGTLRVWDLDEGGQQLFEMSHDDQIVALAVSPDGKRALTGGFANVNEVKRWNLETGEQDGTFAMFPKACCAMALSPDATRVACLSHDGGLHVLAWPSGAVMSTNAKAHDAEGQASLAWWGDMIVTASEHDETVRLWLADDVAGGPLSTTKLGRPNQVAVGSDGVVYVALAYEGITRWNVSGTTLSQLQ